MAESGFRSGFVTMVGRPNVGKSTLINALLGQKVAIVTPKPQTTRDRINGIYTDSRCQIVFIDTPGIHRPFKKINRAMVERAVSTLLEVDVVLLVVDVTVQSQVVDGADEAQIPPDDRRVLDFVREAGKPTLLVLNKIDRLKDKRLLLPIIAMWNEAHSFLDALPISALRGEGLAPLLDSLLPLIPKGAMMFEKDQLTDRSTRFLVSEIVREKLTLFTGQEIPYAVAVEVERFERARGKRRTTEIDVVIHVERDSQKGIVIGRGGAMLKRIGSSARPEIEALLAEHVMLKLFVRVELNWTERRRGLKRFGFLDDRDER